MKWALIGVPALVLASIGIGGRAEALAALPSGAPTAGAQSAPLLPVAHHRHHYRYRHAGDAVPDEAPAATTSGGVKLGQWEFTTRLEAFATAPQGASHQATQTLSGSATTYLSCIQSDRPVPFQFDGAMCKLDSRDRQGPRISWSMTCTNPQGAVRSDGVAQYHGETMDGTLVNHFPGANGKVTDLTQRITGRYLGACPQAAQGTPVPSRSNSAPEAPASAVSGSSAQWVEPPAAPGGGKTPAASAGAAPSAAASGSAQPSAPPPREAATTAPRAAATAAGQRETATNAPAEMRQPSHTRYAHRRHYYRRYYGYSGGGGLFGIRIPFLGGI